MLLRERVFVCGGCGAVKDRDHNAAINIERWPSLPEASVIRMPVDVEGLTPTVETGIKRQTLSGFE